jgi:hypothetical protein
MSFEDNLRRALDPTQQLPSQLHLGKQAYSWTSGKLELKGEQAGFRQLTEDELRRLMRRLQAVPQDLIIFLNLGDHEMGEKMMREMAVPIAALKSCASPPSRKYSHFPTLAPRLARLSCTARNNTTVTSWCSGLGEVDREGKKTAKRTCCFTDENLGRHGRSHGAHTKVRVKDFELSVYLRLQKLPMTAGVSCSSRVSK